MSDSSQTEQVFSLLQQMVVPMNTQISFSQSGPAPRRLAHILMVLMPLAACARVDHMETASVVPDDYRQRHPIGLSDQPQTLDIFMSGADGHLDARQSADLQAFATLFRTAGQGQITVLLPSGVSPQLTQATLKSIREHLTSAGVKGYLKLGNYTVDHPDPASPIRLSFDRMVAHVASKCGEWPADVASGSSAEGWQNRPYYNLGCSTQSNLAAQVADPVDLVRPRQEDPSDVAMRTRAISAVRTGTDPGTSWSLTNTNIGGLGN